jgi:hypothetical protein
MEFVFAVAYFLLGVLIIIIARRRGRSGFGWCVVPVLIALVLAIVGGILVFVLEPFFTIALLFALPPKARRVKDPSIRQLKRVFDAVEADCNRLEWQGR